jgi:plastocyanin
LAASATPVTATATSSPPTETPSVSGTAPAAGASQSVPPSPTSTPVPTVTPASVDVCTKGRCDEIRIKGFAFSPNALKIKVGTTVRWTNLDSDPHTVNSTAGGPLTSGLLFTNDAYSFTFKTAGTFAYICTIHTEMRASITVTR